MGYHFILGIIFARDIYQAWMLILFFFMPLVFFKYGSGNTSRFIFRIKYSEEGQYSIVYFNWFKVYTYNINLNTNFKLGEFRTSGFETELLQWRIYDNDKYICQFPLSFLSCIQLSDIKYVESKFQIYIESLKN